eukprot:TRINITY_DN889_c0_g1_i9.p1 TRINITY_DN889_c0_g1~~TRINITY_DN889_c0_g1_i9.p1  ORF type:complete len:399 (+),score=95.61 TRINITY_DN889_c0_g1_i9:52-1197(+)
MESQDDAKHDTEQLKSCPELSFLYDDEDNKASVSFAVDETHMKKTVEMPLSASETEGCSFQDIIEVHKNTEYPTEVFTMWAGYQEYSQALHSKESVSTYLEFYNDYLSSTGKASETVRAMVSCIAYELKSFPEKYDAVGIMMALAQNGGVCDVQKEIGIRAVYAAMTDSMMQHMKSNALETKVLTLLKKQRVVVSEEVVKDICIKKNYYKPGTKNAVLNSHWITPIQNQMSKHIGIDHTPEPNGSNLGCKTEDLLQMFRERYTLDRIVKLIDGAVNDAHRLLDYQDCVDYFGAIKPTEGVEDSHEFLSEFVFNMDTGKFTIKAVKLMLWKLGIFKLSVEGNKQLEAFREQREVERISRIEQEEAVSCEEHSLENEFWLIQH